MRRLASDRPFRSRGFGLLTAVAVTLLAATLGVRPAFADGVIDFARDVRPILERRCFECHGGESTEGLDLNDPAAIGDYLTAGDAAASDLYQRTIADDDTLMPPLDAGGPLSAGEIAVLKLWIDEGASWPESVRLGQEAPVSTEPIKPTLPEGYVPPTERPLWQKLWGVHGWFHPAIVHFPVALLNLGALFVVLNVLFKGNFREFAFWCLLLGAISSIVACTMGWAFAVEKSQAEAEIFRHRWGGIAVAVWTSVMTLLALRVKSTDKGLVQGAWQIGLLISAGLVGIVGHQGGELVYGEGMYDRAIEKYFGPLNPTTETPQDEPASDEKPADETAAEPTPVDESTTETESEESSEPSVPADGDGGASGSTTTPVPAEVPPTDPPSTPTAEPTPAEPASSGGAGDGNE
ncbi:MAG TPA: cytochrome C [Pirellulaceae bacterium]|nr:cytochrome C [Pirellulaceae bacterium]